MIAFHRASDIGPITWIPNQEVQERLKIIPEDVLDFFEESALDGLNIIAILMSAVILKKPGSQPTLIALRKIIGQLAELAENPPQD